MDERQPGYDDHDKIRRNTPEDLTHVMLKLAKQVGVGEYQISEEDRGVSLAVNKALDSGIHFIIVTDPEGNGEYRLRINNSETAENTDSNVADAWNEVLVGMSEAVTALTAVLDLRGQAETKPMKV